MLFNAESKLIHAAKYVIPLTIAITGLLKYVINRIIIVKKNLRADWTNHTYVFLSASLYVSKRGAY